MGNCNTNALGQIVEYLVNGNSVTCFRFIIFHSDCFESRKRKSFIWGQLCHSPTGLRRRTTYSAVIKVVTLRRKS